MLLRFALRDVLIVLGATALWWWLAPLSAGQGPLADVCGVLAGAGIGVIAFVSHEWGHFSGARLAGSVMRISEKLTTPGVFVFDSRANGKREFAALTAGGFLATVLAVVFCLAALPDGLLATHVARGLVLFLALLTFTIEVPIAVWGLVGKRLPPLDGLERKRAAPTTMNQPLTGE